MKRILIMAAVFFMAGLVYAQTAVIEGYVYDKSTNKPVHSVVVYMDGTSYGTTTDDEGYYRLQVRNNVESKVVFSHMGYLTFSVPFAQLSSIVYIEENVNAVEAVSITASKFDSERLKMMRAFRDHFLGIDNAARRCVIENEDDIRFRYDDGVLHAWAEKPLIVNNVHLGYKVRVDLKEFRLKFKNKNNINSDNGEKVFYSFYSVFEDLEAGKRTYNARRKAVYQRTPLCFFRNLINGTMKSANFVLENQGKTVNPNKYFIVTDVTDDVKYVEIPLERFEIGPDGFYSILDITYNKTMISRIVFKTNEFYVSYFGNPHEYELIEYYGDMGNQRLGQTLPLDFEP